MDHSKNTFLVSVGIPVVKSNFLLTTIESCQKQTYKNLEILILNNASTKEKGDEIESIVNGFNDNRIKYYRNEIQLPMIENWNCVFKYAKGEFFSLLCDDDMWEPEFIQELIFLSYKYPTTNLFHSRVLITQKNEIKNSFYSPLCFEYENCLDFMYHRLKGWRFHFLSDFIARTSALKEIGGFIELPDGWGSDDITWFNIAKDGGVAYSDKPLFIYNNNPENISNSNNNNNKFESLPIYIKFVKDIISNIPINDSTDKLNKQFILNELPAYQKRYFIILTISKFKNKKYILKHFMPFLVFLYKGYKILSKSKFKST